MRTSIITGVILVALGALVLLRGVDYRRTHEVAKVGDVHVIDTRSNKIPAWAGIAGIVVGLSVIGIGATRRIG